MHRLSITGLCWEGSTSQGAAAPGWYPDLPSAGLCTGSALCRTMYGLAQLQHMHGALVILTQIEPLCCSGSAFPVPVRSVVYQGSAMRPGLRLLPSCIQSAQIWVWASQRPRGRLGSLCCIGLQAMSLFHVNGVGTFQLLGWAPLPRAHAWLKSALQLVTGTLSRAFSKGRWDL